jgi:periplasmic protein TonB
VQIAVNGYSSARSGTGLLITAAVHVALGAALLSLGVVELSPTVTKPMISKNIPNPPTPVDKVDPPLVEEPVKVIYAPPVIDISVTTPLDRTVATTTTALPPTTFDFGNAVAQPAKPVAPVFVTARLDPRHAARFQPPYPPASERQDEQGIVMVRVRVGSDGRVLAASVKSSSGHGRLDEAAIEHARRAWRFVPATRDGVAVESWREIAVRFELKNG